MVDRRARRVDCAEAKRAAVRITGEKGPRLLAARIVDARIEGAFLACCPVVCHRAGALEDRAVAHDERRGLCRVEAGREAVDALREVESAFVPCERRAGGGDRERERDQEREGKKRNESIALHRRLFLPPLTVLDDIIHPL
jgi:hypothetical protein